MTKLIQYFSAQAVTAFRSKPQIQRASNGYQQTFGKVAVLFGGRSAERAVSLQSGQNILEALLRQGIDAHHIDPDQHLAQRLMDGQFSRVFIALHGKEGEDGVVQGLLQMLGLPYTGSGVAASALAMDKARAKLVMNALGVPTPLFGVARTLAEATELAHQIELPISIKPVSEGSSIGVTKVRSLTQLPEAFAKAAVYGDVLVEKWIEGKDFFVSIVRGAVLPSVEVRVKGELYDYHAKYESEITEYLCPAPVSPIEEENVRALAYRAFLALGCEGWGRVDLIQDQQGQFWVLEVNTIPGMTSHSLVPMSAKAVGMSFDELVLAILESTLEVPTSKQVDRLAQI